jgi:hypothetical protein
MRSADHARGGAEQSGGNIRSALSCRSSKVKTTRAKWAEREVIWLHRKRIVVHCSILVRDRDHKLVILHEQRHDVPHYQRRDKDLIIFDAFRFNKCSWHAV